MWENMNKTKIRVLILLNTDQCGYKKEKLTEFMFMNFVIEF